MRSFTVLAMSQMAASERYGKWQQTRHRLDYGNDLPGRRQVPGSSNQGKDRYHHTPEFDLKE